MDKVCSLLSESGLPKELWAEAAATAFHLINKSPSSAIGNKIPDEVWYKRRGLDYSYLKRFGCVVYVHTDDGKLNPRAKKCIFIGYPIGVKGYMIWILEEKRCIISRNVVFREEILYKMVTRKSVEIVDTDQTDGVVELKVNSEERQLVTGGVLDSSDSEGDTRIESEEEETDESPVLQGYLLARDRVRREIRVPLRFTENNSVVSCLLTTNDGESSEPYDYSMQ